MRVGESFDGNEATRVVGFDLLILRFVVEPVDVMLEELVEVVFWSRETTGRGEMSQGEG